MQITHLEISGFGNFSTPVSWEFQPNKLGLILGDNESGKSTMVASLFAVLYGLKSSQKKRWLSWEHRGEFRIKLGFSHSGKSYVLERNLENDLVRLVEQDGDEDILFNDYHLPTEKYDPSYFRAFQKIFTLPSRGVLESTAIIYENQLLVQPDKNLRGLITGTTEMDYEDILSALENDYFQVTRENLPWRKAGGKRTDQLLEEKLNLLHEKENQVEAAKKYFNEQRSVQQNLLARESERKKIEQKIPLFQRLLAKIKIIERLQEKIDQIDLRKLEVVKVADQVGNIIKEKNGLEQKIAENYSDILPVDGANLGIEISQFVLYKKRETDLKNKIEELQTEIEMNRAEQQKLPDFADAPDNFVYLVEEIQSQEKKIPALKKQAKEMKSQLEQKVRQFRSRLILSLSLFLFALCAGILSWIFIPFEIWGWAITTLSFFSGLFFTFAEVFPALKKSRNDREELSKIQIVLKGAKSSRDRSLKSIEKYMNNNNFEELKTSFRRYTEIKKRIENLEFLSESTKSEIQHISENPEFVDYSQKYGNLFELKGEHVQEEIVRFRKDQNRLMALSQKLEALPDIDSLMEKKESLSQEISNLEFEKNTIFKKYPVIKTLLENATSATLINRIEKQSNQASAALTELEKQCTTFRIQLQQNASITYNRELLEDEIIFIKEEIEHLENRKKSLILALEVLRDSINDFRKNHLERINEGIQKHLSKIIKSLRFKVELDENFHVQLSYKGVPVSLEQLSTGTRDQLFFAYRLVLDEMLAPDVKFPLIIDDAFVHFDQKRTKNIFSILKKLKPDYQVLIFSSKTSYKRNCDYFIDLNGRKSV